MQELLETMYALKKFAVHVWAWLCLQNHTQAMNVKYEKQLAWKQQYCCVAMLPCMFLCYPSPSCWHIK